MPPLRVGLVGRGWRAEFFRKLTRALPGEFSLVGVGVRSTAAAAEVERDWGVPAYDDVRRLAGDADLVVTSLPRDVNPGVVTELVEAGTRVLSETPPAADADGLRSLWQRVGASGAVQVAEQYPLMPMHAARLALVRSGAIGTPTSVHVSSTHDYHAVALVRGLLGAGSGPVTVRTSRFAAPLADPVARAGWTGSAEVRQATTVLATLDFDDGRSGLYDFTDNQWHNPLRSRRLLVRGVTGEVVDDRVARLLDPRSVAESTMVRRQTGLDLNLEGFDLDHISHDGTVLFRNPFPGLRLSDEEIAIASILRACAAWVRGTGEPPYPLAQACQDHLVSLAIHESGRTGAPVTTAQEPWAG